MSRRKDTFLKDVYDREKRKLEAGQEDKKVWFGLGMFGVVGWSIALPTVVGGFLGIWIDTHWPSRYSWTLMCIIGGLGLGCLIPFQIDPCKVCKLIGCIRLTPYGVFNFYGSH